LIGGASLGGININLLDAFIVTILVYSVARIVSSAEQTKKDSIKVKEEEDRKRYVDSLYGR